MRATIAAALLFIAASAFAQSDVGEVKFANSGAPAAQDAFLRGLALLHNFEYADAAESFRAAQKIDPEFAMAYWGEAMTYNHPLWAQQDRDAARAVLARAPQAKTGREREYLRSAGVLYGDGTKEERDAKYADAMAALHAHYPDDVDATAFYALSLLGTKAQRRDYATYMRAAALLEEVFPAHQLHPGVLHYLIHSYDDPVHAPLGVRAARLYGKVAPNAGHALHMTSHIYVAMGMWPEVIAANQRAIEVSQKNHKQAMTCGHYPSWLEYGFLQVGRTGDARTMVERCRQSSLADKSLAGQYADMRTIFIANGGTLDRDSLPDDAPAPAKFKLAYGDALAAFAARDAAALGEASSRLRALSDDKEASKVVLQQVDAMQLLIAGKRDEGIAALRKTAAAEDAMPFEFGPPQVEKPTYELLAEQLLAAGDAAGAAQAFQSALMKTPGRTRSVEGISRTRAK